MVSKRSKFALLASVFALYGCASGSIAERNIVDGTANKTTHTQIVQQYEPALQNTGMMSVKDFETVEDISFTANTLLEENDVMIVSIRDGKGTMLTQKAFEKVSKQINASAKKEAKRKAEEQKKKEVANDMGVSSDSKGSFSPKTTTYGVDCYGCVNNNGRGGTAVGVAIDINRGVRMPDGSWQQGIKYGKYYIIAADPSIPLCSILKISNHGLSGSGISPNQPYYAIVLDRGGAIQGNHLDLFIGSENSGLIQKVKNTSPRADIIRLGGRNGNSCSI